MYKDLRVFLTEIWRHANPNAIQCTEISGCMNLCVCMNPSTFPLYIPINVELSAHVGVSDSSLSTHLLKYANHVLFGTLSSVISSKRKRSGCESVCESVNAVGSEKRTQAEVKKKWSDIKWNVKRRLAAHRLSMAKTGVGGQEKRDPPCLNRESAQLWVTLLSQGW